MSKPDLLAPREADTYILKSDSMHRADVQALGSQKIEEAEMEKFKLEEKQRTDKTLRV